MLIMTTNRQNVGDKVHIREGKSPDYELRSKKIFKYKWDCGFDCETSGGRTGSSHPIMSA